MDILPPGWVPVHSTASGRKGATRWMIYDPEDIYQGDLVRYMPENEWSWQVYKEGDLPKAIFGTLNDCTDAIARLADAT
jgi:hypothetical protein